MGIFEPIKVGNSQLQHRVVLAPLTRLRCDDKHEPTDLVVEYYGQRATPGGLLISEGILISAGAGAFPGAPELYTDGQVEAWKKVTDVVHAKGGVIFAQIWHAGRFGTTELTPGNKPPVAPSAIPAEGLNPFAPPLFTLPMEVPREITKDEIKEVVQEFVIASKNAIKAGFDGIEIHGANGLFIDQFINSGSNTRTDEYGGSIENRTRLVFEIEEAISNAIGQDRVGYRLSPWSTLGGAWDETPYATWSYILEKLNPNLAYVHFIEPRDDYVRKTPDFENSLDPFRRLWKGPFISAGGYTTSPDLIKSVAQETGNLIAVGRAYLSNPDYVERLKKGLPLNKHDRGTFYTSGPAGYTDYPFYAQA